MKYWIQFMGKSTGYIPGTIPPQFGVPTLIDACGTDGMLPLDGRLSERSMRREALRRAQRMEHFKRYEAYRLACGPRMFGPETRTTGPIRLTYPITTD